MSQVFSFDLKSWNSSWENGDWQTIPRVWNSRNRWNVLVDGEAEAPILALNLNTSLSAAGTPYWPEFEGKILLLEDMNAPLAVTERGLHQLQYNGVFDKIAGLIIGKPEFYDQQGAPFGYEDLFMEVIGKRNFPMVSNFDCGHTLPMLSVPQLSQVRLVAQSGKVDFSFLEGGVE